MLHFEDRVARLREYLRCEHRYEHNYLARPFIAEFIEKVFEKHLPPAAQP